MGKYWIFLVFLVYVCIFAPTLDGAALAVPNQRVANFPKNFRQKLGPIFPKDRAEIIATRKLKESDPSENEADIFKSTDKFNSLVKSAGDNNQNQRLHADRFNPSVKSVENVQRSIIDGLVQKSDKDCDTVRKFEDTDPRSRSNVATFYGGLDISPAYPENGYPPNPQPHPQPVDPTMLPYHTPTSGILLPNPIPTAQNPYSSSIPTGPTVFPMPMPTSPPQLSGNYYKPPGPTGVFPIQPNPNPTPGNYYPPTATIETFPNPNPTPPATSGTSATAPPFFPTVEIVTITRPPPTPAIDSSDLGTFPPSTDDTFSTGPSGTIVPILGLSAVRNSQVGSRDMVPAIRNNPSPNNRDASSESAIRGRNSENRNASPNNREALGESDFPRNRDTAGNRNAQANSDDLDASNRDASNRNRDASNMNRDASNRNRDASNMDRDASNRHRDASNRNRDTLNMDRDASNRNRDATNRDRDRGSANRDREDRNRDTSGMNGSNRNASGNDRDASNPDASLRTRDRKANARNLFNQPSRGAPGVGTNSPQRRLVGDTNDNENLRENTRESEPERESKNLDGDPSVIKDFMFSEIKCFRTRQKEYFGAKVHLKGGFHLPYIRDRPQDQLTSNECHLERTEDPNSYHMKISDLRSCGVEQCADQAMCLTLVFPRVPTLALADDEVTTIKCTPQKSTMTETRTISFAGDSLDTRRSGSTVNGGGQEFAAEVGVFRQNPGTKNGLFVKRVNSGGVVQLGEALQLRSVVRGGDGWTFSKLTDVKVWRMRDSYSHTSERLNPNDASEVITLVDPHGCRNQEFRVISEDHPLRDPRNDLVHHFNFKAFLFRGQRANEPLIVTAKVQACQDRDDCETRDCSRSARMDDDHEGERYKRSPAEIKNSSSIIHDWNSQMALRVVGLTDHPSALTDEEFLKGSTSSTADEGRSFVSYSCKEKIIGSAAGAGFIMLLLCSLAFTLITFCLRTKRLRQNQIEVESQNNSNSNNNWTLKRNHSFPARKIDERSTNGSRKNPNANSNAKAANKPLPVPPSKSGDKLTKSDVSKLLYQLSSQGHSPEPAAAEYECIPGDVSQEDENENENSNSKKDGVYIVYCCKNKGKRSKSAPASLKDKKKISRRSISVERDTEDTDVNNVEKSSEESDDYFVNENLGGGPGRRTVRSVKRNSAQYHRNSKKSVSNKDGAQRTSHGSFPRVICKRVPGGGPGTRSYRERKHVNFAETYLRDDNISTQLSSEDSAYSGSVSSRFTTTSSTYDGKYKKPSVQIQKPKSGYLKEIQSSIASALPADDRFQNSAQRLNSSDNSKKNMICNKSMTHFVTRNDQSTQIIIIPETNV